MSKRIMMTWETKVSYGKALKMVSLLFFSLRAQTAQTLLTAKSNNNSE